MCKHLLLLFPLVLVACSVHPDPQTDSEIEDSVSVSAFPYAEGGGSVAQGGRGTDVYVVTSLDDSNVKDPEPGTLRYAVTQRGHRMVVFKVAGIIHLTQPLRISNGYISILGQSAPGDGICIADNPLIIEADEVVLRFLRVRMGDTIGREWDALSVNNSRNVIIDHCSFSWSTDECVSCYGNENFTLQYCFITESLRKSVHLKGDHGYGGIWGGTNASFHHNLLAHHDSRNPRFDHDYVNNTHRGPIDFVNNVVYNWGGNSAYGGEGVGKARTINFVANYFKPGPATGSKVRTRLVNPWTSCSNCTDKYPGTVLPPKIYLTGNYMDGSPEVSEDNWKGATTTLSKADSPFTMSVDIATQTAADAYETVLAKAGCSLVRDAVDTRIVQEVRNGTYTHKGGNGSTGGLIDSQTDVGGWPQYNATESPKDSDGDGIPDEWETANGLNPNSYADATQMTINKGYTNLEVYLNSIVAHLY